MPTKNYSAKAAKTIGKVILIFFVLSVIVVLSFKYLNSESVSIYDKSFNDIVDNRYSQVDHALITYSDGRLNMIRHLEEFDLGNHTYKKIDNIDENEKNKHYDLYDKNDNVLFTAEEYPNNKVEVHSDITLIGYYEYEEISD